MTTNFKLIGASIFAVFIVLSAASCKKAEIADLGALPALDFEAIPGTNPNNITLVNTSSTSIIPYWKIGNAAILINGDSVEYSFVFEGTYKVTMFGAGHGGIDSITKDIVISESDLNACSGTQLGFITSCTTKKWKLNPEAGAYKVGDESPDSGNWWTSDAAEVTARPCEFNDEYSFSFNANGTFVYDNKDDFFGDGYLGDNSSSCQPSSNYTVEQAPWGSGTFQYSFTPNAGINNLGQLTVIGLGAHIGLQKVRNDGEVTTSPATSITYDVLEMTENAGGQGYDILKLGVNVGGNAWWSFTLRSY